MKTNSDEMHNQEMLLKKIRQSSEVFDKLANSYEVWVPESGWLAGRRNRDKNDSKRKNLTDWSILSFLLEIDNCHYPMADSYLQYGIDGVIRIAAETLETLKNNLQSELQDQTQLDIAYLESLLHVWKRFQQFVADHMVLALECAKQETSDTKKKRYEKIAKICQNLTINKPNTFCEALQLFWFTYLFRSPFGAGCIGRLDQLLYPFYKHDCEMGIWDQQEAEKMLEEMFARMNEINTGDTLRNLMLSGQDAKGNDQTNEITYLILVAYENTGGSEPHLNVRFHEKTQKKLRDNCIKMLSSGSGQPTIYFDEAILPAMEKAGICHEDACQYANDGCTETVIAGKSAIVFWQYEMVKTVELTLFGGNENPCVKPVSMKKNSIHGVDFVPKTNLLIGIKSKKTQELTTFSEFLSAFFEQMDHQLDHYFLMIKQKMQEDQTVSITSPFTAGTFEKCLRTGKDPLRGGGFDITNYQLLSGSIGTAADCLYAIQSAVYEKKLVTMEELIKALSVDFEGYEVLRQQLLHLPKYGNDKKEVDALAKQIADHFLARVNAFRGPEDTLLYPGLYNIDFKIFANVTGATPDGRRFRDAIAEHCSPTPGAAKKGPTAILNSASALPMKEGFASSVLHLTLDKNGYSMGADRIKIIDTLLRASEKKKIPVLSLTMYDKAELLDAQLHPEKHQDLIVRVWGFQARFTELDKELQDHIINRIS